MTASRLITLHRNLLALLIAFAIGTGAAFAQGRPQRQAQGPGETPQQQQQAPGQSVLRLLPPDAVTQHSVETAWGKVDYSATAGTLSLIDQSGERIAAIFYTAYVAKGSDAARRPITFVFNGGPGAASAYLHLGLVGPRIVDFGPSNRDATARLQDNPHTWLPFTDLVMIDPIGSGWSRPAKPDGANGFFGVRRDAEAIAKTIALYVANNQRSASPKYLLGESYGGFGGTRFALGAALQLPSLAAAELERKGEFSRERIAEAERFALTEYLSTLAGPPPKGEAAHAFYARVADMTGLPVELVTQSRGFIRDAYVKNLRAKDHKIVSRYDATFTADDPFPDQQTSRGPDPLLDGMTRAYGSAFATYAREELGFKTEMTYVLLANDIAGKWDWGEGGGRATASVSEDIRELLALDPGFRLMIAHGYSDMVTPYSVSQYLLDHLPAIGDPTRAGLRNYRGGHMFYIDANSRRAFSTDAKALYDGEP